MTVAELRSFIFIDQLQPRTMCYLGTWIRGSLPRSNMAAQIIEVAPGLDIEPLTDVALKHADVQAGILVVERQYGYLEIHSRSTASLSSDFSDTSTLRVISRPFSSSISSTKSFRSARRSSASALLPSRGRIWLLTWLR